jgi:hypothetical protein
MNFCQATYLRWTKTSAPNLCPTHTLPRRLFPPDADSAPKNACTHTSFRSDCHLTQSSSAEADSWAVLACYLEEIDGEEDWVKWQSDRKEVWVQAFFGAESASGGNRRRGSVCVGQRFGADVLVQRRYVAWQKFIRAEGQINQR